MINSVDISVVVQGAIDNKETKRCLKSIRKYLPKAEIILSTWKGSDISELDYDILTESDDPGAIIQDKEFGVYNNVNRQLVSTQAGLKKANRKYTLKIRTDFYLDGNRFLKFFDKFPKTNEKYVCFKHRVLVSSVYSREYSKYKYKRRFIPFHPSDFFFFGLTEDVKSYFENTPLMPEEDMANYKYLYDERKPYLTCTFRYAPEQYFCLSFFRRFFPDIKFEDWTDWNKENIRFSKELLYNNFIFLSSVETQIKSVKHERALFLERFGDIGLLSYKRFVKTYKRVFDKKYSANEYLIHGYLYDEFVRYCRVKMLYYKFIIISIYKIFYYQFC